MRIEELSWRPMVRRNAGEVVVVLLVGGVERFQARAGDSVVFADGGGKALCWARW